MMTKRRSERHKKKEKREEFQTLGVE